MTTSAALLRTARERAGLTQTELAARSGVTQSVISAYERGRREPGLPTVQRLVTASGHTLETHLTTDGPDSPLRAPRLASVLRQAELIREICHRHGVGVFGVFGSIARGEDDLNSDLDLLVDARSTSLFQLMRLSTELRTALGIEVDVIPAAGLKPRLRDEVLRDLVAL